MLQDNVWIVIQEPFPDGVSTPSGVESFRALLRVKRSAISASTSSPPVPWPVSVLLAGGHRSQPTPGPGGVDKSQPRQRSSEMEQPVAPPSRTVAGAGCRYPQRLGLFLQLARSSSPCSSDRLQPPSDDRRQIHRNPHRRWKKTIGWSSSHRRRKRIGWWSGRHCFGCGKKRTAESAWEFRPLRTPLAAQYLLKSLFVPSRRGHERSWGQCEFERDGAQHLPLFRERS